MIDVLKGQLCIMLRLEKNRCSQHWQHNCTVLPYFGMLNNRSHKNLPFYKNTALEKQPDYRGCHILGFNPRFHKTGLRLNKCILTWKSHQYLTHCFYPFEIVACL